MGWGGVGVVSCGELGWGRRGWGGVGYGAWRGVERRAVRCNGVGRVV